MGHSTTACQQKPCAQRLGIAWEGCSARPPPRCSSSCQQLQKSRIIFQRPFLLLTSDKTLAAWQEYCLSKESLLEDFCKGGSTEARSLQPARRILLVPPSWSRGRDNSSHRLICTHTELSCSSLRSSALKGNVF